MIELKNSDLKALGKAIADPRRKWNEWIKIGKYGEFYLRRCHRYIGAEQVSSLDMSSSEIKEKYRGKGIYKLVMKYIEENAACDIVFHENVHNQKLANFLVRSGYESDILPSCYYKRISLAQ